MSLAVFTDDPIERNRGHFRRGVDWAAEKVDEVVCVQVRQLVREGYEPN